MRTNKPATLKEIAKRLKLSTSTVSRALKDHPSIGLVTTMRVKQVAEELNYEPNNTAIFFKQRKTFTIGVVLPSLSEAFFSTAISSIENIANSHSYNVILGQSLDDPDREYRILETMKNHRIDGIIVSLGKNTTDFAFLEIFRKANIPIVFFDCVPDLQEINAIICELETGMVEAVDTFVSCEHKQIAFINGPEDLLASKERENGFLKGLARHSIQKNTDYILHTDLSQEGNVEAMQKLLSLPKRPSAIICFNDYVALDVMKTARERGLVINQDVFFISFANYPIWNYIENPLMASIEQFPGDQATKAAEILFELIESKNSLAPRRCEFSSKLIHQS